MPLGKITFFSGMLSIVFLLLRVTNVSGQTTEFQGTVNLRNSAHVFKIITVSDCPQTHTSPNSSTGTITYETKYTNDKTEITIKDVVVATEGTYTVGTDKVIQKAISPYSAGKANLYLDEKDKSKLYVNYWLNGTKKIDAGTTIDEYYPEYNCDGIPHMEIRQKSRRTLKKDEYVHLVKVYPHTSDIHTSWFENSSGIHVYNTAGSIDYYLVDKYDKNAKYVLELENRECIYYNAPSLDLGALTIPFKYRFSFTRNGISVKDDVTASFNVGVYVGYKLTRYKIINKAGTYTNNTLLSLRIGPFLNVSTATLDSSTTSAGDNPMKKDDKQNIAVLSSGIGLMGNIKGVQLGVYLGWDFGMGADGANWNYNKKPWLGFGVGYRLTDLFNQKE